MIVWNTACGDRVLGLRGVNGLLTLERVGVFGAVHGVGDLVDDKAAKGRNYGHDDEDLDQGIATSATVNIYRTAGEPIIRRHILRPLYLFTVLLWYLQSQLADYKNLGF